MTELEQREIDHLKAQEALNAVKRSKAQRWQELSEQWETLRYTLQDQCDQEFCDALKAANDVQLAAQIKLDAAKVAAAATAGPYPLGTILCEWMCRTVWRTNEQQTPWQATGRRAVVQVYTAGDSIGRTVKYDCPSPGDIIARLLGKSGKPGKRAYRYHTFWKGFRFPSLHTGLKYGRTEWLPEGERPIDKIAKEA